MLLLLLAACSDKESISIFDISTVAVNSVQGVVDATPAPGSDEFYAAAGSALVGLAGDAVEDLAEFAGASGVVVSDDGGTIYVADTGADGSGAVFSYDLATGEATVVAGSEGTQPVAIELSDGQLYLAGTDADGSGAVMRMPTSGGQPEVLANGLDQAPTGVVVAGDGAVYAAGGGSIYEIRDGEAVEVAGGLRLGSPAGIALTPDDGSLLISSLSAGGTSQVLILDRDSGEQSTFDDGISENTGSGGLHRSRQDEAVYGWAGVAAGGEGRVYRIEFQ